jgi:hypothetical protein
MLHLSKIAGFERFFRSKLKQNGTLYRVRGNPAFTSYFSCFPAKNAHYSNVDLLAFALISVDLSSEKSHRYDHYISTSRPFAQEG